MSRKREKRDRCPNCGQPLGPRDNFCAQCGQENHTHKLPIGHFAVELLAGLLNFDTKLLRTGRDLFVPPGLVVRNFNANQRARYVPPLRLYLFTSVVFFIVLAWMPQEQPSAQDETAKEGIIRISGEDPVDSVLLAMARSGDLDERRIDSLMSANGRDLSSWERKLLRSAIEQQDPEVRTRFSDQLRQNFSKALFLLLPVFALLLYLLNWSRRGYFTEHLVFALYFHAVVFMLLLLEQLIKATTMLLTGESSTLLDAVPLLLIPVYLPWAIRTAYQRSWGSSILLAVVITALYLTIVLLALAAAAVVTAW